LTALAPLFFAITFETLLSTAFLYLWKQLPSVFIPGHSHPWKRLLKVLVSSTICWIFSAITLLYIVDILQDFGLNSLSIAVLAILTQAIFSILTAYISPVPAPVGKSRLGLFRLGVRGIICALFIAMGIVLSSKDTFVASLSAIYPVILVGTLVNVWANQGEAVAAGAVNAMMLGSLAAPVSAGLFLWFQRSWDVYWASASAFLCAGCFINVPVLLVLRGQHRELWEDKLEDETPTRWKFAYK